MDKNAGHLPNQDLLVEVLPEFLSLGEAADALWGPNVSAAASIEEAAEFIEVVAKETLGKEDDPDHAVEELADTIITGVHYLYSTGRHLKLNDMLRRKIYKLRRKVEVGTIKLIEEKQHGPT